MTTSSARFALEKQSIFAATGASFLSATLLFSVQPMFTKMVLPVLGGSAATWSIAMVFFQAVLLLGYAYAHLLTRYLSFWVGAAVHITILLTAAFTLPVRFEAQNTAIPADPALWILSTFTFALGLPFLALSTHGPLLQAWFARSQHERAHNPYFLYIASNIGSFAALLAYPFLIEPFIGLKMQSQLWSGGFVALILLILYVLVSVRPVPAKAQETKPEAFPPIELTRAASWVGLGLIPSALLVSVTSHISTDIAAAPLLWVVPLGLYLLSFMLAFRDKLALIKPNELHIILVWGVTGLLINMMMGRLPMAISLVVHLGLFTVIAIAAHHALYQLRPRAEQLTSFYFCMSLGGVLGGLFAALVAPLVFSKITEYPLMLVVALATLPGAVTGLRALERESHIIRPLLYILCALSAAVAAAFVSGTKEAGATVLGIGIGIVVLMRWRHASYALLAVAISFLSMRAYDRLVADHETYRSFFGVTHVKEIVEDRFRVMVHGTTIHGAMRIRHDDDRPYEDRPLPTTYYSYEGGMGEAIAAQRARLGTVQHTALIGLGTGALACHFKKGEEAVFYELDPLVAKLAQDPSKFRFLSDCDIKVPVVLGDARLTLTKQSQMSDIILVDAFSSDSIPVHLLTVEAFDLYLSKLARHGLIVLHVSNNYFYLGEVLARAAASRGLHGVLKFDGRKNLDEELRASSSVAVLARSPDDLASFTQKNGWEALPPVRRAAPWSDDYSTILEPLIDMWRRKRS